MDRMTQLIMCACFVFTGTACGPASNDDPGGSPSSYPSCGTSPPPCTVEGTPIADADAGAAAPCTPEVTVSLYGPPAGSIPAGTQGADFLRLVFQTTACGAVVVRSVQISMDSPDTDIFCDHLCGVSTLDWNLSLPRLMADTVTIDGPTGFAPVPPSEPGKIRADFEGPFAFDPSQKVLVDFRVDVAPSEVVPGSMFGKRFRALDVRVDLDPNDPATLHLPAITGALQTVIAP